MATVPRYTSPQVAPSNLPGVRISDQGASPEAFGAGIGRGIAAFGEVAGQIAAHEQKKADDAAQMEVENGLAALENATIYDPDNGLLGKQGKDAINITQAFEPAWQRGVSDLMGKVPRHLQGWAQQAAARRQQDASRILMRHSAAEADKYYLQLADTQIATATDTAVLNYQDPGRVDEETARVMVAADRKADLLGVDAQTRERLRQEAMSGVQRAVLERMIAEDPSAALARLGTVRGRLTGEDQTRVEALLRPVLTDANADAWLTAHLAGGALPAGAAPVEGAAKTATEAEAIARASVGRTVGLESGGRADAKNPRSTATGAGQFLDATWLDVLKRNRPDLAAGKSNADLLALRADPKLSREMTEAYAVENCKGLFQSGLPVTLETAYLCHRFGLDGARRLLRAPPQTPVAAIVGAAVMRANPDLKGKTVADLSDSHAQRAGDVPPAVGEDGKPDWAGLLTRAQAIANPTLRERVTAKIERQRSIADLAERETTAAMVDRTYTAVETADPSTPLEKVIGPEAMAWARREGRVGSLEARLQQRLRGELVQDDPLLVERLDNLAIDDPTAFIAEPIKSYGGKLTPDTRKRLLSMQADLKDPAKRGKAQADWSTDAQRIRDGLVTLGSDKWGDSAKARGAAFGLAYRKAVADYVQENGKKPVGRDADDILHRVVQNFAARIKSDTVGGVVAMEKVLSGLPVKLPNGREFVLTPEIRNTIIRDYTARFGHPPTDTTIVRAAIKKAGG